MMCDFCNEFTTHKPNTFAQLYDRVLASRVLLCTQSFVVLPTIGQIVEGYLLVVPVKHYLSVAEMPTHAIDELADLKLVLRSALEPLYGSPVFFEHGISRYCKSGGCGINHAHLHVVPLPEGSDLHAFIAANYGSGTTIGGLQLRDWAAKSYIFYEDQSGEQRIFEADYVPSQYLRKGIAKVVSSDAWNWRGYGVEQRLLRTYYKLKSALTLHSATFVGKALEMYG